MSKKSRRHGRRNRHEKPPLPRWTVRQFVDAMHKEDPGAEYICRTGDTLAFRTSANRAAVGDQVTLYKTGGKMILIDGPDDPKPRGFIEDRGAAQGVLVGEGELKPA